MTKSRFLMLILLLASGLLLTNAQDSLIYRAFTLPDTTCSVETALKIIERHTGLSFSYNSGLINKNNIVTLRSQEERLIDILQRILGNPTLAYSIIGKHLVVYQPQMARSLNPEKEKDTVIFFEIRGRVLDRNDRQPLPYTSVYLTGKSIGVVSNEEGEFLLKLSTRHIRDTLTISCIGYKPFSGPVSMLINTRRDYLLKTDVVSIQEVVIRKLSPVMLLQSAADRIKENYPLKPAVLTCFYRETIKQGNRYMMISEAVLENYKAGYAMNAASDQVKILKGRKSEDFGSGDTVILKLKAGLGTMLQLDVVKNLPDFLSGENLSEYEYRLADIIIDNGQDHYAIEFSPKPGALTSIYSGRIILGIRDLSFKWIEFFVDPDQLERATDLFIIKKPAYLKVKLMKANYKVAFRETGGKYCLYLVECETAYRIRNKNQLTGSVYTTTLEMAVTDIDTTQPERFPFRETARLNEFFTEQVGTYDEAFWGEYNFVTPDESLEQALVKLSRQLRKTEEGNR